MACHLDSGIGLMKEGLTAKQTGGWFFFCSPNLKNEHSKQAGDISSSYVSAKAVAEGNSMVIVMMIIHKRLCICWEKRKELSCMVSLLLVIVGHLVMRFLFI